jgi:hypothetical protein
MIIRVKIPGERPGSEKNCLGIFTLTPNFHGSGSLFASGR